MPCCFSAGQVYAAETREVRLRHTPLGHDGKPASNATHTNKYTWYNFLPLNLFEQFHRFANWYFLLVVVLNWVMQVFGKEIATFPLVFVLACSSVKDIFEDWRRRRSDREVNNRCCSILSEGGLETYFIRWRDVRVGDVIYLKNDETIPADVLLLWSSGNGVCFVETSNLDGEANLKQRMALLARDDDPVIQGAVGATATVSPPDKELTSIRGTLASENDAAIPFGPDNTLLRGCAVRNTDEAIGVVLFVGKETKAVLNSGQPKVKRSKLESRMNQMILLLMVLLFAMCLIVAVNAGFFYGSTEYWQLQGIGNPAWEGFQAFWIAIIVFQVLVPIGVYVMLEVTKTMQCLFVEQDLLMYDPKSDKCCEVRALNIPEELGQIQAVFTDKTGTLTDNLMVLRQLSVVGIDKTFCPGDPELRVSRDSKSPMSGNHHAIHVFLLALATCNTVLIAPPPEKRRRSSIHPAFDSGGCPFRSPPTWTRYFKGPAQPDVRPPLSPSRPRAMLRSPSQEPLNPHPPRTPRDLIFEAESPDEAALVYGVRSFDYFLCNRVVSATCERVDVRIGGVVDMYEVVLKLPFDHVRKCMTVVLRNPQGDLYALCKGADTSVAARLADTCVRSLQETMLAKHTMEYSRNGLRTLWFAYRTVSKNELQECQELLQSAQLKPDERATLTREVCDRIEANLLPLGVTAIEDKLQECVPETIEMLRQAGLKVWLLTGDKIETAVNIAISCNLISEDMTQIFVEADGLQDCAEVIRRHVNAIGDDRVAIVIDGNTLSFALVAENRQLFYSLVANAAVVLCCRVSPDQKADVVRLVKQFTKLITLAIGDGANDVAMLKAADVGVGIAGREGVQAVLSSDFAIPRFWMLRRLLLVHGHWAYDRIGYMVMYYLYKNYLLCFVLFFFHIHSGWSGQSMFDSWAQMLYSVVYTSFPVLVLAGLEQHVRQKSLLKHPAMYEWGRDDMLFNCKWFVVYVWIAAYQAVALFYIPYLSYVDTGMADLWSWGLVVLFATVFVANVQILLDSHFVTIWLVGSIGISIAAVLVIQWLIQFDLTVDYYWDLNKKLSEGAMPYLVILLAVMAATLPHFTIIAFRVNFSPSLAELARREESVEYTKNWLGMSTESGPPSLLEEVSDSASLPPPTCRAVQQPFLSVEGPERLRRSASDVSSARSQTELLEPSASGAPLQRRASEVSSSRSFPP